MGLTRKDGQGNVYIPARFCLTGSSSISSCSWRSWKNILENSQWVLAMSFHDGFLLTGPGMFKLSVGLLALGQYLMPCEWRSTSNGRVGKMQWIGFWNMTLALTFYRPVTRFRSGRNQPIWVSQSSCSLRPVKKYKLCCSPLHWGLNPESFGRHFRWVSRPLLCTHSACPHPSISVALGLFRLCMFRNYFLLL